MDVFKQASDPAQSLSSEWVEGRATIVQMQATGKNVDTQPELLFELVLDVSGTQSTVNHSQIVSLDLIGQLRPGRQIPVKVDPADHSRLLIGLVE